MFNFFTSYSLYCFLSFQLFAVQLISHLAVQYPIPKAYSMCKYVSTRLNNLLAALPVAKRNQFFVSALPSLVRICKAFPPLREETTELLLKIGKVAVSQLNKSSLTGWFIYLHLRRIKKKHILSIKKHSIFTGNTPCPKLSRVPL